MVPAITYYTSKLNTYLTSILVGPEDEQAATPMPHREPNRYAKPPRKKCDDTEVWKEAPLLKGTTAFPPRQDVKNILVTGGEGFIACWLVRHLVLTYPEYNVVSLDKLDYPASRNNTRVLESRPNFTFVHADVTSPDVIAQTLRRYNIDTIFHFAAQSHVDHSFGNSYQFTTTNVLGTHVMLETARNHEGIKHFIHVSTDEVYGEVEEGGEDLPEDSAMAPTNPYAATKAAAEMMVHAYWKSFKIPVITVRINNVFGPHQFPEKIIPKFSLLLQRNRKLTIHGDGCHTRRYIYAGDTVDAFDTILHRGCIGEVYNIGSSDEISNTRLCEMLLRQFGHDPKLDWDDYVLHIDDRPFNDRRYAVDDSKLRRLGWCQKTKFEDALKLTVQWYREFGERWWGDIDSVLVPHPKSPGVDRAEVQGNGAEDGRRGNPMLGGVRCGKCSTG